jgi:hypothetical protein
MPKLKKPAKKKSTKPAQRTKTTTKKAATRKPVGVNAPKPLYSEEYVEYLERYALYGTGRPHLSPAEFDRLDDEMLDLLALESEVGLNDEQIVRMQELEYLLLDSES